MGEKFSETPHKTRFWMFVVGWLGWLSSLARSWGLFEKALHHELWGLVLLALVGLDGVLGVIWALRFFLQKELPWKFEPKIGLFRWPLLVVLVVLFPYLVLYSAYVRQFDAVGIRYLLYANFSLAVAWLLAPVVRRDGKGGLSWTAFLAGALLTGSVFAFLSAYTHVSSFPFRLSWSEGNRLWDYSLMFARDRYIYPADQPLKAHIDPGRQFLWGLIYLIPGVNIFVVRLWSAFLFTVPYLVFAWVAFLKPKATRKLAFWAGLWGFLFLSQGPIYTPLLLSALAVSVAEMALPWWLGLPLMAGATYYAAITRYTWIFAPALWAIILVLGALHREDDWRVALKRKGWWLVGGGLLGAVLSGRLGRFWSVGSAVVQKYLHLGVYLPQGNSNVVTMADRQPLIWSRLLPNPTFAPGILLGALLAVGPVFLLWWLWRRRGLWQMPKWAMVVIGAILAVLFGMGVVISLKIGGGSNLHNLDMFLIAVLFGTVVLWRRGGAHWLQARRWLFREQVVLGLLVFVPMYFVFLGAQPRNIPEARWWEPALRAVQHYVREAKAQGGEILFMDQRQLLTFGYVEDVPLVPEYEKKLMMDKAMAADAQYFAQYYHDLATHRFALIITEPLKTNYEAETQNDFALENNAWVKWVAAPTLCYYEPVATFKAVNLQILVPRETPQDCQDVLPVPPAP